VDQGAPGSGVNAAPTRPDARSAVSAPVLPTPTGARQVWSLEMPVFWIMLGLMAVGAWRLVRLFSRAFGEFPVASGIAVGLFTL
jgi:hypothetical protein